MCCSFNLRPLRTTCGTDLYFFFLSDSMTESIYHDCIDLSLVSLYNQILNTNTFLQNFAQTNTFIINLWLLKSLVWPAFMNTFHFDTFCCTETWTSVRTGTCSGLISIQYCHMFTFVLCFLRFQCFFQKLESFIVVRKSGVLRILFGLYYVVQPADKK